MCIRAISEGVMIIPAISLAVLGLMLPLLAESVKPADRTIVVAHRGNSSEAPENTLASFRSAVKTKADYVECDVWQSKDGHLVILHDGTFDRTTNGKGAAADMQYSEIRKLDAGSWFNQKFAGEQIPSLEEVLSVAKEGHKRVVIELKDAGVLNQVLDTVKRRRMLRNVLIASFAASVGEEVKKLKAPVEYMQFIWDPNKATAESTEKTLKMLEQMDCKVLGINFQAITPELVQAAHARGIRVNAWTVDEPGQMQYLAGMGVDIVTTNRPALACKTLSGKE